MPTFSIFRSTLLFQLLIFLLHALFPVFSLSNLNLTTGNPNFDPQIAILGDARISSNGSFMRITNSDPSSSGLLLYKDPFKIFGSGSSSSPSKMVSFSTEFDFSFTGNSLSLSLMMCPSNFAYKFLGEDPIDFSSERGCLGIEFGASMDGNVGNSNNVVVSATVNKRPSMNLVTKSGEKLKSWIDYGSSSKRLEIRLGKMGDKKPYDPIIACYIDLFKMWEDKEVYVALGSRNGGNSSNTCNVYSWGFRLRKIPNWMHSLPADPHGSMNHNSNESLKVHRRKFCLLTVLGGMIFATGCGALLAFMVLFVWAILVNRHTVFPIEGKVQPLDFKYEKIDIVMEEKYGKMVKN